MAGQNPIEYIFSGEDDSGWIYFKSDFYFLLIGTFTATVHLQYSPDEGENISDLLSSSDEVVKVVSVTKGGGWYRSIIKSGNYTSGSPKTIFKV
jgi:hypothetical protein